MSFLIPSFFMLQHYIGDHAPLFPVLYNLILIHFSLFLWLTWFKPLLFLSWTTEIILYLFSLLFPPIHLYTARSMISLKCKLYHGTLLDKIIQ